LLDAFDAPDSSSQFRTQQPAIGGLIREPSNSGKSLVNTRCGQATLLKAQPVAQDDTAIEGKAGLRTVPRDKLVYGELVDPAGSR
jgi:hypothetical protein